MKFSLSATSGDFTYTYNPCTQFTIGQGGGGSGCNDVLVNIVLVPPSLPELEEIYAYDWRFSRLIFWIYGVFFQNLLHLFELFRIFNFSCGWINLHIYSYYGFEVFRVEQLTSDNLDKWNILKNIETFYFRLVKKILRQILISLWETLPQHPGRMMGPGTYK